MLIKEFLPNPAGKDAEREYVILENNTNQTVNLSGWKIQDLSGKTFNLKNYILGPQEELMLPYGVTKLSLNNNGETLYLFDLKGLLVDELGYRGSALENRVISHTIELADELKNKLLETMPEPALLSSASNSLPQIFFIIMCVAAILAGFSVWLFKKAKSHERINN